MSPKGNNRKNKISPLPQILIDQIAAGEVVERPSSVVKELVENSLDAGATRIEVHLKSGGIEQIQIIDDGFGMTAEEIPVALQRHTTSKLRTADDLENIRSLGFRGEALSSICSVATVELRSKTNEQQIGTLFKVTRGEVQPAEPVGCATGTHILIQKLFDKIPARQKFLRSATTEFAHCARTLRDIALAAPGVHFQLTHNERKVHQYNGSDRSARTIECLRPNWEPMCIREETPDFAVEAYLSPPELISDKGDIQFVINGRTVRHRSFQQAFRNAYRDTVGPHHIPAGVVYLDIRRDWLDVNVHPQKLEIRILKQERLFPWMVALTRKTISHSRTIRVVASEKARPNPEAPYTNSEVVSQAISEIEAEPYRRARPPSPKKSQDHETDLMPQPQFEAFTSIQPKPTQENLLSETPLRYLGQVKASYLVCEDGQGVLFIDQHALHEKAFFEQLVEKVERGALEVQKLLVPRVLRLEPGQDAIIEAHHENLEKFGFSVDLIGDREAAVKSYPTLVKETRIEEVVMEILSDLEENSDLDFSASSFHQAARPLLATIACHSVVRANQTLSPTEAGALLEALPNIKLGQTCPHGRPVMFRMNFNSIEKNFER